MCQRHDGHRGRRADALHVRTVGRYACACSTPTEARRKCRATASAASLRLPCVRALACRVSSSTRPPATKGARTAGQEDDALTFRASMGMPQDIRPIEFEAAGETRSGRCRCRSAIRNACCSTIRSIESRLHTLGPGHRTPSEVSRPHECLVRKSGSARSRPHPDLGARSRADAGVGHRRVRRRGRGGRRTAARRATSK